MSDPVEPADIPISSAILVPDLVVAAAGLPVLDAAELATARRYADASRAPGTQRAYASDWRVFPPGVLHVSSRPCRPTRRWSPSSSPPRPIPDRPH